METPTALGKGDAVLLKLCPTANAPGDDSTTPPLLPLAAAGRFTGTGAQPLEDEMEVIDFVAVVANAVADFHAPVLELPRPLNLPNDAAEVEEAINAERSGDGIRLSILLISCTLRCGSWFIINVSMR